MQSESLIPVRYAETDQMGVVHHSHYPVYFEQGRSDFFERFLVPYAEYERQGLFAPVLSYQVEIHGRLSYGDTLRLLVFPVAFRGLRVEMGYRGYLGDLQVVSGNSRHALTGPGLRPLHPRRLPPLYEHLRATMLAALPSL